MVRVAIIGGGVVGLTSSVVLARAGYSVVLFEKDRVFSGASGVNLGILSLPLGVLDGFSVEYVKRALSLHSTFSREYGYSLLPTQIIVPLRYIRSILGEAFRAISSLRWFKIRFKRVRGLGLSLVVGDTFLVDPEEYRDALRRRAVEVGVDIEEGVAVEEIVVEGGRAVSVRTSRGEEEVDVVVVAAGPWTPRLLGGVGVSLSVEPIKGYTVLVETSKPISYVIGVDPVFVRPHQRRRDVVLVGGYKVKSGLDTSIVEEHVEEMLRRARGVGVDVSRVLEVRVGLRPCLDKPITTVVGARNLVVSTGHCRHGMMLAPLASTEVLKLVEDIVESR